MFDAPLLVSISVSVYLLIACIVFARRKPGYSHARHTISELGEVGALLGRQVSVSVFLPVGAACAVVAILSAAEHTPIAALAAAISIGYLVGALFPCDPGSPMASSGRQLVHNAGGAAEYLGGALALFVIAESSGLVFRVAGFAVAVSTLLLTFESPWRGLVQRIAETCLFGGLILALALR